MATLRTDPRSPYFFAVWRTLKHLLGAFLAVATLSGPVSLAVTTEPLTINSSASTLGDSISVENQSFALKVTSSSGSLTAVDYDVTAKTDDDSVDYTNGMCVWYWSTVGSIAEDTTISASTSYGSAYAVDVYYSTINSITGNLTAESSGSGSGSTAAALATYASCTIGEITSTAQLSASSESTVYVYGVDASYSTIGDVAGTITVSSTVTTETFFSDWLNYGWGTATGIYAYDTDLGEVSATIEASSDRVYARGINLEGGTTMKGFSGEMTVTSSNGFAIGIEATDSDVGTISGDISVKSTSAGADATGIDLITSGETVDYTLTFGSGATVTTEVTGTGKAIALSYDNNGSDYNGMETLTLAVENPSESGVDVTLTGYIVVGTNSTGGDIPTDELGTLIFESGSYDITSEGIWASTIIICADASVTLNVSPVMEIQGYSIMPMNAVDETSSFFLDGTELIFYVDELNSSTAALTLGSEYDLSTISSITVILSDEALESWENGDSIAISDLIVTDNGEVSSGMIVDDATFIVQSTDAETGIVTTVGSTSFGEVFDNDGSVTMSMVPEPSTATLSLLALAALCVRRKRRA